MTNKKITMTNERITMTNEGITMTNGNEEGKYYITKTFVVRESSHLARRACLVLLCFCVAPEFMRQPSDSLLCTLQLLTRTRARSEGVSTPTRKVLP